VRISALRAFNRSDGHGSVAGGDGVVDVGVSGGLAHGVGGGGMASAAAAAKARIVMAWRAGDLAIARGSGAGG